jgi:hypothetical protein
MPMVFSLFYLALEPLVDFDVENEELRKRFALGGAECLLTIKEHAYEQPFWRNYCI